MKPLSNHKAALINIILQGTFQSVTRLLHLENYLRIITSPYQIVEILNITHKYYKYILILYFSTFTM